MAEAPSQHRTRTSSAGPLVDLHASVRVGARHPVRRAESAAAAWRENGGRGHPNSSEASGPPGEDLPSPERLFLRADSFHMDPLHRTDILRSPTRTPPGSFAPKGDLRRM